MQLTRENISDIINQQQAFLEKVKIAPRYVLIINLYIEEILLRYQDQFGEVPEVSYATRSLLGQSTITLKVKSPCFDPREVEYEDFPGLFNKMNQEKGYHISHQYRGDTNILKLTFSRKKNLIFVLFLSLLLGVSTGLLLKLLAPAAVTAFLSVNFFGAVSTVFIKCVKMLIGPLIFFTIASSVSAYSDLSSLGRMGKKLSADYLMNAIVALAVATGLTLLLKPGMGETIASIEIVINGASDLVETSQSTTVTIKDTLMNIFPSNFFKAFVDSSILQIIFISFLLGISTILLPDDYRTQISNFLNGGNLLFSKMTLLVMMFLPISVFCSMANVIITLGLDSILLILQWLLTLILCYGLMVLVYILLIWVRTSIKPTVFLKRYAEAILGTFAMGSCNSSMSICLKNAEKLGVNKKVSSFSIPIGVSLHCASNCIFYMISLFFLANLYSTAPVTPLQYPVIFFSIFVLGVGAPSVSGSGPICVALLLMQLGLPAGLISLIIGLDPFVSMFKSACSCIEDAEVMLALAKSEKQLDIS